MEENFRIKRDDIKDHVERGFWLGTGILRWTWLKKGVWVKKWGVGVCGRASDQSAVVVGSRQPRPEEKKSCLVPSRWTLFGRYSSEAPEPPSPNGSCRHCRGENERLFSGPRQLSNNTYT